jgi:hypothetical protein
MIAEWIVANPKNPTKIFGLVLKTKSEPIAQTYSSVLHELYLTVIVAACCFVVILLWAVY